jgi:NAD(P)-dependent dehydrogenase (short-subunit alcohol dehydrogenase family)
MTAAASQTTTPRTALVTGATRGIGQALVVELTRRGMTVFATGRDAGRLATLRSQTGCLGACCDLADPSAVVALYAAAREALGAVDVLVNNAGFNNRKAPLADTTLDEFDHQYAVNLRAPYILCREAVRDMTSRRYGHIVNVLSTVAAATWKPWGSTRP